MNFCPGIGSTSKGFCREIVAGGLKGLIIPPWLVVVFEGAVEFALAFELADGFVFEAADGLEGPADGLEGPAEVCCS